MPACRTLLGNRFIRRSKFAIWIIPAAIERVALARTFFHQFPVRAQRAFHANKILLDVLAFRISAARRELAKTSVANHHIAVTFRAKLIERNVRNFLALIQSPRGLAIGIAGARHELAEAPTLEHHHPPAILAIFFLRGFLNVRTVEVRQVDGIFFSKRAALRILFVVRAARVERTVFAPLDDQRRSAALALFVSRLLHPLDVFHVLLRIAEVFREFLIKIGEGISPLLGAVFYFV